MKARVLFALLLALSLVLAAVGWHQWGIRDDHEEDAGERSAVLSVARAQVLDLTTLDSKSLDPTLKRMTERLTGDFKKQFGAMALTFAEVVEKGTVSTTGTVDSAGVSTLTPSRASVLVATTAQVRSKAHPRPATRTYRFKVTLHRDSGAWLVAGMEFVS